MYYDIVKASKIWVTISVVTFVLGAIAFGLWGLQLGIDFTGGATMEISFPSSTPTLPEIQTSIQSIDLGTTTVRTTNVNQILLAMQHVTNDQREEILQHLSSWNAREENFASVGPSIGAELKKKSIQAVIIVLVAIILFISYAFRKVSRGPVPAWAFGCGAIVALVHDIGIVIGVFAVLGHFLNVHVDSLFVTALLTILGFSVHDTIVVFDRIRERLKGQGELDFTQVINESINTTLARSLNTSLTTIIVLLAVYLFGGEAIQYFILALLIGIISGTYSSIFIASPFLLLIQKMLKR